MGTENRHKSFSIQNFVVIIAFFVTASVASKGLKSIKASIDRSLDGTDDEVSLKLYRGVNGQTCKTGRLWEGFWYNSWSAGDVEEYKSSQQDFGDCGSFEADRHSIAFSIEKPGDDGLSLVKMEFHIGEETYIWTGKAVWDPTHEPLTAYCSKGNCLPIDCTVSEWTTCKECSADCTCKSTRKIIKAEKFGGKCPERGDLEKIMDCRNNNSCPSIQGKDYDPQEAKVVTCPAETPCLCQLSQSPCRFNGYPDVASYRSCIAKGHEDLCCPSGWKYNSNSLDVTCIKDTEHLIGQGSVHTADVKRCSDLENPSCREDLGSTFIHSCRSANTECAGSPQTCVSGSAFCLRKDTCVEIGNSWTKACHKDGQLPPFQHILNMGIGVGIFLVIMLIFISVCCYWSRKETAVLRERATEDTGRIELRDNEGNVLSEDDVKCCWKWLDRSTFCGGTVQHLNRMRGLEHVARVDNNPDYEYGEAEDNIEIIDFNPYYEAGNEEEGVAEMVDFNPHYRRGDE